EENREAYHQGHRADLELRHSEIATEHEHENSQYADQSRHAEVHHVRAEHVTIFGFENGPTRWTLLFQGEPVLKNATTPAERAVSCQRPPHARDETGETIAGLIRLSGER